MRRRIRNFRETTLEELAKRRIRKIRGFFVHLMIFTIAAMAFILKEYGNVSFHFPPLDNINWFFMSCWIFILAVQGLKLFTKEVILGKNWENRQIDKMMQSEFYNQKRK